MHKWRSEEDAILVGYNTMLNDKPKLTTRLYPGKNPQRFVMQRGEAQISELPYTPVSMDLQACMQTLYEQRIQSVIVEGGRKTLQKFIEADLWDEARVLVGNQVWGKGVLAPVLSQQPQNIEYVDHNKIMYVRRYL